MSRPDEWIHGILDRMAPIQPAEPSNLDRLDGVGVKRCEANAKRGTGTGMCNRPLDETGHCDREGDHL